MNNNAMTSVIKYGICWSLVVQNSEGNGGGTAQDNRRFINGVFWDFTPRSTRAGGAAVLREMGVLYISIFADEPDFERLMIDASHCKVHPHAAGAKGDNQDMRRTKGDSIPRFTLL